MISSEGEGGEYDLDELYTFD